MGNKLGWIIAAGVVAAVALVILLLVAFPSHSAPTAATTAPGVLDRKSVQVPLRDLLGFEPNGDGNAADDYAKALDICRENAREVQQAVKNYQLNKQLPGLLVSKTLKDMAAHVADAAGKRKMQYTLTYEPKELSVCIILQPQDPADTLTQMARGLMLLAKQEEKKMNLEASEKVLQGCFLLGWHMVEEQGRPYMVMQGMDIQNQSLERMAELYRSWGAPRAARMGVAEKYLKALRAVWEAYEAKSALVRTLRPSAGDIFNLIENDRDRSWRVQGLLVLGIVKYGTADRNDLRYANRLMAKYAASGDALEASAAKAAMNLTREQYRMLGSQY